MSRMDQARVTMVVAGRNTGVWDKLDGGEGDSTEEKYASGGMGPEIARGGRRTRSNMTATRRYELARDHELARWMDSVRGSARVTVSWQPLDDDGADYGRPVIRTGVLKKVTWPGADSNANATNVLAVEVSTDEVLG